MSAAAVTRQSQRAVRLARSRARDRVRRSIAASTSSTMQRTLTLAIGTPRVREDIGPAACLSCAGVALDRLEHRSGGGAEAAVRRDRDCCLELWRLIANRHKRNV